MLWKIQNSWSSNWGMDGFAYIPIQGDYGVGGMNQYIQWVDPK